MSHLPTVCDGCARVSLVPFAGPAQSTPDCPACGGARHVVPSCCYAPVDVELFEELSDAVADELTPLEAEGLAIEVGRALWSGSHTEGLDALARRFPSVMPQALVAGDNQARKRRLLLMLKTIFEAVALTRRSGTLPLSAALEAEQAARRRV